MSLITTQGRARQKAYTLAKKAGVTLKAVVFTRRQLLEALGYDPGKRYGTKRDTCCGRCFVIDKVIWLSLPTTVDTIAHEIIHLVTSISHTQPSFQSKTLALARGKCPAKAKANWYEVSITSIRVYKILELSANDAKEHYGRGKLLGDRSIHEIHAKRVN